LILLFISNINKANKTEETDYRREDYISNLNTYCETNYRSTALSTAFLKKKKSINQRLKNARSICDLNTVAVLMRNVEVHNTYIFGAHS
jgi:predicted DNA binding CopG/RHH family protein